MSAAGAWPRIAARDVAGRALRVLAVDPTLGCRLRGPAGPLRDAWLEALHVLLPSGTPWRRAPLGCSPARLEGHHDLPASLRLGRVVEVPGLLAEARGGIVLLASAERLERDMAACLVGRLDGLGDAQPEHARPAPGLVALDEGRDEEQAPALLIHRLAIHLDLTGRREIGVEVARADPATVRDARAGLAGVTIDRDWIEALCAAAEALGIPGVRAPQQAVRVAKAAAACSGRDGVEEADVALAAQLCLGPRARVWPQPDAGRRSEPRGAPERSEASSPGDRRGDSTPPHGELVVAAAHATLPASLLARTAGGPEVRRGIASAARRGPGSDAKEGRAFGHRPGRPRAASDLDLTATLLAALPRQALRGRPPDGPLRFRLEDLRIVRRRAPRRVTTIFVVDASGSAAHGRLAEAKGAVELLLAECYVRRDEVALIAFRGTAADLLLPPTRSLARAKRELADVPGGGGTPLASGLDLALAVAQQARRAGRDVMIPVLTDGRGNIGRDGSADRTRAEADALAAAAAIRSAGLAALVIDVSPRPGPAAARLADALAARYLPLPRAAAQAIADALRPATP